MEQKVTLLFDPVEHKYSDHTGRVYTSVTTVIGKYQAEFNQRYWAMYTAIKDMGIYVKSYKHEKGMTVKGRYYGIDELYAVPHYADETQVVLMKWKAINKEACDRGNEVHDFLEDSINLSKGDLEGKSNDAIQPLFGHTGLDDLIIRTKHDLSKTTIESRYPDIYMRLLRYIDAGWTIFAEKKVYSTTYGIAGMIDVLLVRGKKFIIMDWKTNKAKMRFRSGYYKKARGTDGKMYKTDQYIFTNDYLKYPLNDVYDCKGMIYSLQLSLYAYIMELWGRELFYNGLEIFHIRPGELPELVKIDYKKEHIERMLNHFKSEQERKINKTNNNNLFGIF